MEWTHISIIYSIYVNQHNSAYIQYTIYNIYNIFDDMFVLI